MHLRVLRRYLLEGLTVIGPAGVSLWVLWWLFKRLDGILGPYLDPVLGWSAPGLGLLALLFLLVVVGWLTERALGGRVVALADELMSHLPVARQVYRGSRRIVRTVLGEDRIAFQEVVALEWPEDGRWVVGFVSGPAPEEVEERLGEEAATIYMPTAPNPASGYLIMMPRRRLVALDVTVEEAFTFVISAGSVPLGEASRYLDAAAGRPVAVADPVPGTSSAATPPPPPDAD